MKRIIQFGFALSCLFVSSSVASASGEAIVRLKDGTFLFGEVLSHDEAGIQVRRLDTGGVINLKWNHLFPAEENNLRLKFGYKDQSSEEVLIEVDRLRLDDGTEKRGIIINRSGNDIDLKVKGSTIPIKKSRIVAPADRVQVNALDVYTKDELYEMKLSELNPQDAKGYLDLSRYLVRIRDLRRALENYKKVQAMDSSFHSDEVGASINRLEMQAAKQDEIDWVDSIDSNRGRANYAKAIELCTTFVQKWPQSSFLSEVNRKKQKIESERDEALKKKIVLAWYAATEHIAGKAGSDRSMTQAEAQAFAEKQMSKDVLAKVAEEAKKLQADITPEQVRSVWLNRDKSGSKLASMHRSVYGDGTFILGVERAQKGCTEKKEEAKKDNASAEEKALQERVKKYFDQYRKSLKGGGAGEGGEEEAPETWWSKARSSERMQWILSYYAEFSGDMIFLHPSCELCQTCNGTGTISVLNVSGDTSGGGGQGGKKAQSANGGMMQATCPSCHKVRVRRGVYYK